MLVVLVTSSASQPAGVVLMCSEALHYCGLWVKMEGLQEEGPMEGLKRWPCYPGAEKNLKSCYKV